MIVKLWVWNHLQLRHVLYERQVCKSYIDLTVGHWNVHKHVLWSEKRFPQGEYNVWMVIYLKHTHPLTRGTPRVQFANIRKMVFCQGLPYCLRLCVDPCMARHAQSLKSTCLTTKFGSFLDHEETGEKGQNAISSSVQHPISLIFAIHVSFIIPLPMMWILLTKPMQKSVTTVCFFTLQFR